METTSPKKKKHSMKSHSTFTFCFTQPHSTFHELDINLWPSLSAFNMQGKSGKASDLGHKQGNGNENKWTWKQMRIKPQYVHSLHAFLFAVEEGCFKLATCHFQGKKRTYHFQILHLKRFYGQALRLDSLDISEHHNCDHLGASRSNINRWNLSHLIYQSIIIAII